MRLALYLAQQAYQLGEIPVGAVVVHEDEVIAWAHNEKEFRHDATAHAEILALQRAARYLGNWHLNNATLYCNLEPCPMCAGAMLNTRLKRLVYACRDPKAGAAGSVIDLVRYPGLNHQVQIEGGLLQEESSKLLKSFFADLRRDG
ncbi:tRNA-specific adenosine deaminase [Syntrophomonas zehnderi OL-4]|uniref:tRNA-specific adenosine deaminase n=2 Tax=Syntrophomonas TaxID=862 RepID=A0A0E4G9S7_9FIRM|nr:tRNA-specific adenosine deaminase [Syntrophomonas zehnderi OL-4]